MSSIARRFYESVGTKIADVIAFAKTSRIGAIIARAKTKIVPGKIAKSLRPFLGRVVVRVIPILGTGLAILEFSQNVEAHGIGGAVVRATPLLGDVVSVYDMASDLAKQITDEANAAADAHTAELLASVTEAAQKATEHTAETFQELASQIDVTNTYGSVDTDEITKAVLEYRDRMQEVYLLKIENRPDFDFDASAAYAKRIFKDRLKRAAQKDAPPTDGPIL
ncbi:MAG: hypothetical protein EXS05_18055 [Planctomycetaceae bacterium]|nr:hypothetical protein [Planctomycetaceae bacterium]